MNTDSPRVRLSILGIVVFALFASLFARLWYLQVMVADDFQVEAQANRVRVVPVEAPRGRILDVTGRVLVGNAISVRVTIDRSVLDEVEEDERLSVLSKLAEGLNRSGIPKTVDEIQDEVGVPGDPERPGNQRYSPYVPVPVADGVPEELKIWIDEHGKDLPGVAAERVAVRQYPYGKLAAHVLGYTGQINDAEFEQVAGSPKPYTLNDQIGKSGVELRYESYLRGTPGTREIEVDASNQPIRDIGGEDPIPGDDLLLNINIDVQAQAEQALATGLSLAQDRPCRGCKGPVVAKVGSTVVLNPQTGGVMAMASYPSYDPSQFIDGISAAEFEYLDDPASFAPQNNRAIQGQYAPGSTFKPFTAASALTAGILTPETTINDTGQFEVPGCTGDSCFFSNDNEKAYGLVDLRRSLTVSSDVFYYGIGAQFWRDQDALGGPEKFRDLLQRWGFDKDTGIDLPFEQGGRIPSPQWLNEYCEQIECVDGADTWRTGNHVNMSVGQGDVLLTPLQIANAYAAIGNGGTVWEPHVVNTILTADGDVREVIEPKELSRVELLPEWRSAIMDGLLGVTTAGGGTAVGAFSGFDSAAFPIAAKTGTAQVGTKAPTAVFGAYAPAVQPRFAISVLLEESGYGGAAAAPVARRLFDVLSGAIPLPVAPEGGQFELLPSLVEAGDVRD